MNLDALLEQRQTDKSEELISKILNVSLQDWKFFFENHPFTSTSLFDDIDLINRLREEVYIAFIDETYAIFSIDKIIFVHEDGLKDDYLFKLFSKCLLNQDFDTVPIQVGDSGLKDFYINWVMPNLDKILISTKQFYIFNELFHFYYNQERRLKILALISQMPCNIDEDKLQYISKNFPPKDFEKAIFTSRLISPNNEKI